MAEILADFIAPGTGIKLVFSFYETDGTTIMDVSGAASFVLYIKPQSSVEVTRAGVAGDAVNEVYYVVQADDFTRGQYTMHMEPVSLGGVTEPSSPVVRLYVKDRHQD